MGSLDPPGNGMYLDDMKYCLHYIFRMDGEESGKGIQLYELYENQLLRRVFVFLFYSAQTLGLIVIRLPWYAVQPNPQLN